MYTRCDVASSGRFEYQAIGNLFPRVDINPDGVWVTADCYFDGSVFIRTSAGEEHALGPRHPDNPICPRWLPERAVFKVAWVNQYAQGMTIEVDGLGHRIPGSEGTFDASGAGSQGILDIDPQGTILFKDAYDLTTVDGLPLLHWRDRGDFVVGVLANAWVGVSVFVKSTGRWYRAYPYLIDLLPGIAENGTVAASGADPGGFIPMSDWTARPFDPHAVMLPPVESVPLLHRPFGGGCFTFNDDPGLGNLTLPIRPGAAPYPDSLVIASGDYAQPWFETLNPATVWGVYAGAAEGFPMDQAVALGRAVAAPFERGLVIYQDSWPLSAETVSYLTADDVALVLLIRESGESRDAFKARAATLPAGVWVSLNLKGDAALAVETFIAAAEVARDQEWPGWFVFAAGRSDVAWATLAPYLERFLSGITGAPPALTIDPPVGPVDPVDPPDPPDPIKPPPVTSQVRHALLMVEEGFVEVYERAHQDAGLEGRPYLALHAVDGRVLAANADTGTLEWRDPGTTPGAWERFISIPGGYAIVRDGYLGLVARAAWLEDD